MVQAFARGHVASGVALLAVVSLAGAAPGAGQPERPQPRFRAGVDLVTVDVTVLDKRRQPVRGLPKDRFTVFEDGEPREIAAFSEVEVPSAEAMPTGWMRNVAPDVKTNASAASRIFVLVLDDAQVGMRSPLDYQVKAAGHYFVDRLGPDDMTAIVFTADNRHAMDFTADRARLHAAIDKFRGGAGGAGDWFFDSYSTNAIRRLTKVLADIRDRRKAIVYVSPGVAGAVRMAGDDRLRADLEDTLRDARMANVAVYAVNPAGLRGLDFEAVGTAIRDRGEGADLMQTARNAMNAAWDRMNEMEDHLSILASNTGGFVVGGSNTFAVGVEQIFLESASYYLLGFRAAGPPDGKRHRLEVRVGYPDLLVHARSAYSEPKPPKPEKVPAPTARAIAGLLPETDLPMRAVFAPFAIPGKKQAAVAVTLGLERPVPEEAMAEEIRVLVRAFDAEGRSRRASTFNAKIMMRPAEIDRARYEVVGRIDVDPGRYQMRVSAESRSLGRTGSVYAELIVPDFRKDIVSLSGVVLTASPALASAGAKDLEPILAVAPTTQREFAGHTGAAFVRLYQGGKRPVVSVPITSEIVNGRGDVVVERSDLVEASRFDAARAADHRLELPVATLEPGPYLLTFEAALDGQAARRDVRFVVIDVSAGRRPE